MARSGSERQEAEGQGGVGERDERPRDAGRPWEGEAGTGLWAKQNFWYGSPLWAIPREVRQNP